MKLIFCPQINVKGFLKLILSFSVCVASHPQITQNNKFAISLQYLKKEVRGEVDFLHAEKYESLLEIDAMIFVGLVKHSQSSQNSKFAISLSNISKKEVIDHLYFFDLKMLFIFLIIVSEYCCALYLFQNPNWSLQRIGSNYLFTCVYKQRP